MKIMKTKYLIPVVLLVSFQFAACEDNSANSLANEPPALQRALRYAPAAALAALIAPDLLLVQGGINPFNPKLLAGIVVSLIALRTRRPWLPFLLGMGLLVGLQKGLGW